MPRLSHRRHRVFRSLIIMMLVAGWLIGSLQIAGIAQAGRLFNRAFTLANSNATELTTAQLNFDFANTTLLGSIMIQFCSNSPLETDPCTAPTGFDASQVSLSQQIGETGFQLSPATTTNQIILTRPPVNRQAVTAEFVFTNLTNPAAAGTDYVKVWTYDTAMPTANAVDFGAMTFEIFNAFQVQAEVPPYLLFCVAVSIPGSSCTTATGDSIDFGNFSSTKPSTATTQFQVGTNAGSGYSVRVTGPTLTSGNNVITGLANNASSQPGTAQFGLNLRANQTPTVGQDVRGGTAGQPMPQYAQPNSFRFVPGEVLASAPRPDYTNLYTVSYLVNVPSSQPPGVYASTLTYVCLANF